MDPGGGVALSCCGRWLSACLWLTLGGSAVAQTPLRWGCDPSGGAPFVMRDDRQNYTGFEYELAELLGRQLGRPTRMVPGDWSNLPQLLNRDADTSEQSIDVVLNGYEYEPELATQYTPTRPYYVYRLSLVTTKDNEAIRGWADLYRPHADGRRKTVGVLGGSVCQKYMQATYGDRVQLLSNPDVATVMKLVADGRIDATVQDSPAADYYAEAEPALSVVGEPVHPGFYVMYHRKGDVELGAQLNAAILAIVQSGELRKIYEKYGVWNADQERLDHWQARPWPPAVDVAAAANPAGELPEPPNPLPALTRELLYAALVTVKLAVLSFPLAVVIGLLVAMGRVYGPWWLAVMLKIYVEVVRGTPLLLQLFMIYYLLPELLKYSGVGFLMALTAWLTPVAAGVIGLAVNYSAYEAENYRAGLLAVPRGQLEAAQSLGMTPWVAITRVVVPQAVRTVIPPVTNDFIALFKDTSACSIILVVELTRKYNELFNFNRGLIVELAFITAGLYLLMSYPLAVLASRLERRMDSQHSQPGGGR